MSFSAHADAKGIMQLISQSSPASVLLVHGEAEKMGFLRDKIQKEFGEFLRDNKLKEFGKFLRCRMWKEFCEFFLETRDRKSIVSF